MIHSLQPKRSCFLVGLLLWANKLRIYSRRRQGCHPSAKVRESHELREQKRPTRTWSKLSLFLQLIFAEGSFSSRQASFSFLRSAFQLHQLHMRSREWSVGRWRSVLTEKKREKEEMEGEEMRQSAREPSPANKSADWSETEYRTASNSDLRLDGLPLP